jgi:hypothetical protein
MEQHNKSRVSAILGGKQQEKEQQEQQELTTHWHSESN